MMFINGLLIAATFALARGSSQPWQDTMDELTGRRNIDASSIVAYFRPVTDWLAKQNEGRARGW